MSMRQSQANGNASCMFFSLGSLLIRKALYNDEFCLLTSFEGHEE